MSTTENHYVQTYIFKMEALDIEKENRKIIVIQQSGPQELVTKDCQLDHVC